ncbi:ABC transporter permease [Caldisalinibacter kiritimatiensis]|uniref:ABC-2 type transporter n=1 Tax=Caldisalinibacter kiritimatiensis TaxID=1304284 RepID=R1ASU5_9FIRM|nr:ABC transporter permease [Caldisalinibacter kiritimatiensis]EOD00223.1 ABC-2 type transporter [Caldisalinibacter kiritimatiensis]
MLNRFLGLVKKDIITGFRNYYFLMVIIVALLFVGIIQFVIPEDTSIKPSVYYYIDYEGEMKAYLQEMIGQSEEEHDKIYKANSREEIIDNMKKSTNSIGMVITAKQGKPSIEFILQGYENEQVKNALLLSMRDEINSVFNEEIEIDVVKLKQGLNVEKIPTNKNVLPLFVLTEPVMLGFILIAALIFMEKDEGTIKAYIVTPGRLPEYLASKITLMLILGIISVLISTILVVGFDADYVSLLIIVILGGIFASSLGLIVASFFKNLSQAMIWIIAITLVLSIPTVSYFFPSFAPWFFTILPTYPLMFAIREAIFQTGNSSIIYSTALYLLVVSIITYGISILTYRLHLARD